MLRIQSCTLALLALAAAAADPSTPMKDVMSKNVMVATLTALEDIAKTATSALAPNGNRDRGFETHQMTVDYIKQAIADISGGKLAPDTVTYMEDTWVPGMPSLVQVSPADKTYAPLTDFNIFGYSPPADITGTVETLGGGVDGCSAEQFTGFTNGNIVLLPTGGCTFVEKVLNAQTAGAVAVLIHYQLGDDYEALDVHRNSRLSRDIAVPVFSTSYEVGQELISEDSTPVSVQVRSNASLGKRGVSNVCVDLPGGDKTSVVIVGAHTDSVPGGPGINDDGSGTALVLELLRAFGEQFGFEGGAEIKNGVRLCWWTSEEWGFAGSRHYVSGLSTEQHANIAGYLNFDMMGSKNGFNSIIDGSETSTPEASGYITTAFVNAFESLGQNYSLWGPGGSDFVSFLEADIPAGAIRSGAGQIKTAEEALKFGGTANAPFDPCYHQACDTVANVDPDRLLTFARVGATVLEQFTKDADLKQHLQRSTPAPPGRFPWMTIVVCVAILQFCLCCCFCDSSASSDNGRVASSMLVDEGAELGAGKGAAEEAPAEES